MPPTRALLLPIVPGALASLFELEGPLFLTLRNALVPGAAGVPIPGVVIEDVFEAYLRVLDAFPEGTPEFVEETEDELHGVLLLVGPDGGNVAYVAKVEVTEADLALLGAFSDALGHAADPSTDSCSARSPVNSSIQARSSRISSRAPASRRRSPQATTPSPSPPKPGPRQHDDRAPGLWSATAHVKAPYRRDAPISKASPRGACSVLGQHE
ncbi:MULTISPECIES: hypothetical protein [unclassified Streptomyces]|uniref:hypothetical protein n=1 Tax=unclassified Streptomyces TaxID=2593676 RepID=UPI002DD97A8A|nr:hypothetical protein [Streptomyces sp. NBC_01750]WSA98063.1 hypothetical protein OIE54_01605 [Streptomyces sp. NBC_01794]WSD37400.1 hypothetical protein OG966_39180 [Streptomyces sp. NBC_01750]